MNKLLIGGSTAGFFSMFRGTVGTFLTAEENGLEPLVVWNNTIYNDAPQENAWEYYFDQVSDYNPGVDKVFDSGVHNILPREYKTRLVMHRLINKYVRVKNDVLEEVIDYRRRMQGNVLGVHIRMTDKNTCTMNGEPESGKPISVDLYKKHIDENLKKEDSNIFLATDDYVVLEDLKREYGNKIFSTDSIRSTSNASVHHHLVGNNFKKGRDVLIDCLLLSGCRHIIKGISNVALCAMFWNLDLTCENLNSIYNNDTREDFVNQAN